MPRARFPVPTMVKRAKLENFAVQAEARIGVRAITRGGLFTLIGRG
jgi:hypothetical protein